MSVDVNQLFDMLFWDNDEETQQKGLEEAAKVKYLSIFIMPAEGKGYWDNCATVLAGKTDEELEPYMFLILEWFQDGNWPGFMTIYERLRKIPAEKMAYYYHYTIISAQKAEEIESRRWLTYLAGLIRDQELLELLPSDQQELMKKYYERFWKLQDE